MVDDASAQSETLLPLPKFCFQVKWDQAVMLFQEASGLHPEDQPVEAHHGDKAIFGGVGMPSVQKHGNVTMKRGVFTSDNQGRGWFNEMMMNTIKPVPVTISFLDEHGSAIWVWTLANAWPAKIMCADMKPEDNEVAIDTLEIAHQGLTIAFSQ
jgi:phage tail-like protein